MVMQVALGQCTFYLGSPDYAYHSQRTSRRVFPLLRYNLNGALSNPCVADVVVVLSTLAGSGPQ